MFIPQGFKRPFTTEKKEFRPKASDHLVLIQKYDIEKHIITGLNQMGKVAHYKVSAKAYERFEKRARSYSGAAKFMGHRIDDKMQAAIPVGNKVVLEQSVYAHKVGQDNLYEANCIINSTAQEEDKLFCGIFSASRRREKDIERISGVQHWAEKGFFASDKPALLSYLKQIDQDFIAHEAGERITYKGLQIRVLKRVGDEWLCIDSTHPYDNTPGERDADGNEIRKSGPLSKKAVIDMCKGYADHVKVAFPDFEKDGCILDICTYTNYLASQMSGGMDLGPEFSGLSKITARKSKVAVDDVDGYTGKNFAARGIIELTTNKAIVKGNAVTLEIRDMVQKLHVNNFMGDTRMMVAGPDGAKVQVDPSLVVPVEQKQDVTVMVAPSFKEESSPAPLQAYEPDEWMDEEVDPFAD